MTDYQNRFHPHGVLPSITRETITIEAKTILIGRAGISSEDVIRWLLEKDDTITAACPDLADRIAQVVHTNNPRLEVMANQLSQWRRELALQALDNLEPQQQEDAVIRLGDLFSITDTDGLRRKMQTVIRDALRLAGADDPQSRVVPSSALELLEELENHTGDRTPHEIGDPCSVPQALTLCEIIEHCAVTNGASQPERLWMLRCAAQNILPELHEELQEHVTPSRQLQRETASHGVPHDQAIKMLRTLARTLETDPPTG